MSRPIKFRGKRKDNGEWVYGDYMTDGRSHWIVGPVVDVSEEYISPEWWAPIVKETLGQFTGLTDRHGKEIWEGDVANINFSRIDTVNGELAINSPVFSYTERGVMRWIEKEARFAFDVKESLLEDDMVLEAEVLGNIYENPDLLE